MFKKFLFGIIPCHRDFIRRFDLLMAPAITGYNTVPEIRMTVADLEKYNLWKLFSIDFIRYHLIVVYLGAAV